MADQPTRAGSGRRQAAQDLTVDPSCVMGRRLVCDDDLCHGVDQTICGLWSGHDFAGPLDDLDYDEDGSWLPL